MELVYDALLIVVAVGCSRHELWGIMREEAGDTADRGMRHFVLFDAIPYAEQEPTARRQDPARLAICCGLVGEKHDSELANRHVEGLRR